MLLTEFLNLSDEELHNLTSLELTIDTSHTSELNPQTIKEICNSLVKCKQLIILSIDEAVIDCCDQESKRSIFSAFGKLSTLQVLEIAGDNLNKLDSTEFKFFVEESLSKLLSLQELYLYDGYGEGSFDATDSASLHQLFAKTLNTLPYFRKLHLDMDFNKIEINVIELFLKGLPHIKDFVIGEANLICVPDSKINAFCCGLPAMHSLVRLTVKDDNFHSFTENNLLAFYVNLGKMNNLQELIFNIDDFSYYAEIHFNHIEKLITDRQEKINIAATNSSPENKKPPLTIWCVYENKRNSIAIAATSFYSPKFNREAIRSIIAKKSIYQQCESSNPSFFGKRILDDDDVSKQDVPRSKMFS